MAERLPTGRVTTRYNWKDIIDAGGQAFTGEDEPIEDAGSDEIYLPSLHAFLETGFRINTQEDGLGTDLTVGVDYSINELNDKLTGEYGENVYEKITVLNATYQTGTIYAFGDYAGDVSFAEYFNTIQEQLDELYNGTNQKDLGHLDYYSTYKDRPGLKPAALNNAVSQGSYSALFAEIGHLWNDAHVQAGDTDLSASSSLFYPTPPPGYVTRSGIPDSDSIDATADIDDATELITLSTADYNSFKIFKANGADGVPVRAELISGALPGGITDEKTVYYIRFKTTPDIELYDTEANAINTAATTGRVNLTDAVGTFRLTQQGIVYDDAMHAHWHEELLGNAGGSLRRTSWNNSSNNVDSGVDQQSIKDPIADNKGNGTPRTANETRGREQIMYAYFKVESVQVITGEPVSALRDVVDWTVCTGWIGGAGIVVPHSLGVDFEGYNIKILIRDPAVPSKEYTGNIESYGSAGTSTLGQIPESNNSISNFLLRLGTLGGAYINTSGQFAVVLVTWEYKVILTKPNLVATYADTSFRKVYDISDGVDITHTLPDATNYFTEQIIKRRGSGSGKVIITASGSNKIKHLGVEVTSIELKQNGTAVLFPSGGNWEVKTYNDGWDKVHAVQTEIQVYNAIGPLIPNIGDFISVSGGWGASVHIDVNGFERTAVDTLTLYYIDGVGALATITYKSDGSGTALDTYTYSWNWLRNGLI
jgi:hypothetical protein